MKQVLQDLRTGRTEVAELPVPNVGPGCVLIKTRASVISSGTEKMLLQFGAANWVGKARQQPDKLRMTLEKARTDGIAATLEAVARKLDHPVALGYCNVGTVVEVGRGAAGFSIGDRVVSNGKHAEYVSISTNLCASVPEGVADEAAAFCVLGAIGLQGIRLAQPTLGERFVVIGLGLIGLLTVQLLRAHGCRVLAFDFDAARVALASMYGAEAVDLSSGVNAVSEAQRFSVGRGVDGVLITAATESNEPIHQAAAMCRKRGRIVLVGVAGLKLSRADFYEKELTFQVSCSYGPGRYDPEYEEKGRDYPIGYVRWTEQRNFEAILDMMADGRVDVSRLISHRYPIEDAPKAYELIASAAPSLGVVLQYPFLQPLNGRGPERAVHVAPKARSSAVVLGFIGSGNYASGVLIPAFKATSARLKAVSSSNGISSTHAARKFGIELSTSDSLSILADSEISGVVVTTRHVSHADWVIASINAGKHVFVEKPLAMTVDEIEAIQTAYDHRRQKGVPPIVAVGFNRRFAPHVVKIAQLLQSTRGPKSLVITVNAGAIPPTHWTQDSDIGGGRLIGEACHFIDLLRFLAGRSITCVQVVPLYEPTSPPVPDTCTISLSFSDGSIGTIHYFANGNKSIPKERLEIFVEGKTVQLDNFRKLCAYGWPGIRSMRLWRQDKGQKACADAFVRAIQTGVAPIPFDELVEVARVTIQASEAARRA